MIDIESKIISCREDTNDYRLCLTREEINEIKEALNEREQIRAEAIEEFVYPEAYNEPFDEAIKRLREQNK